MTTLTRQAGWLAAGLGVLLAAAAPTGARADVAALEALQAAHPNLVNHWTFEGADNAARRADKKGTVNMAVVTTGVTTPVQVFTNGYDASSAASRSYNGTLYGTNRNEGSGLRSISAYTLPATGTVEFLVRTTTLNDGGIAVGGVGTGTSRWYLWYNGSTESLGLGQPAVYKDLAGGTSPLAATAAQWYYVAHTWQVSGQTNLTVNSTVAALRQNGANAAYRVSSSATMGDVNGRTLLKLGIGIANTGSDLHFDGAVDAVAIYDNVLDEATLRSRLATLGAPYALRLENMQAADTNLVQHWPFEGTNDTQRFWNRHNAAFDLTRRTTTGFTPEQTWDAGYDGQGYSSRSYNGVIRDTGSAVRVSANLTLPTNATLEYLVKPVDLGDNAFITGGVGPGTTRWYMGGNSGSSGCQVGLGNPAVYKPLVGTGTPLTWVSGRWYYVALTWGITGATNVTLNGYVADMTRPTNPTLLQTITNMAAFMGATNGNTLSGERWGLGMGPDATFFNGQLDAVALYNRVYTKEELQARLGEAFPLRGTLIQVK